MKREGQGETDFIDHFVFGRVKEAKKALDRTKEKEGPQASPLIKGVTNTPAITLTNDTPLANDRVFDRPLGRAKNLPFVPQMVATPRPQVSGRPPLSGRNQKELLAYILQEKNKDHTYKSLQDALGINERSLIRTINKLEELGIVLSGVGLSTRRIIRLNPDFPRTENLMAEMGLTSLPKRVTNTLSNTLSTQESENFSKIDEIDKHLSFLESYSQETLEEDYPNLALIGFRVEHLRSAIEKRKRKGYDFACMSQNLERMDYEAGLILQGKLRLTNTKNEEIKDVPGWYTVSLGNPGFYRKPQGWSDPRLEASKEELSLAEKLKKSREEAHKLLFSEWCERLTPQVRRLVILSAKMDSPFSSSEDLLLDFYFKKHRTEIVRCMEKDPFAYLPQSLLDQLGAGD